MKKANVMTKRPVLSRRYLPYSVKSPRWAFYFWLLTQVRVVEPWMQGATYCLLALFFISELLVKVGELEVLPGGLK